MSSRHLPAGQNIPPAQGAHGFGPAVMPPPHPPPPGVDMPGGPPVASPAPGPHAAHTHGPPRRRQPPPPHHPHPGQYAPQYHQHMNPPMYANYMPYSPQQYYGMPPQYQNGAMPGPGYMPYSNFPRSPPAMPQYSPMVGVTVPPSYPRHAQSPALSTTYQPPPAPGPMPPHTPSSTHSSQMIPPPTPPTPQQSQPMPPPPPPPAREPSPAPVVTTRESFRAPLPWLSRPDEPFPARKLKTRRKLLTADSQSVSLPVEQHEAAAEQNERSAQAVAAAAASATPTSQAPEPAALADTPKQTVPSGQPAPVSPATPSQRPRADTATSTTSATPTKGAKPAVPLVPVIPKNVSKPASADKTHEETKQAPEESATAKTEAASETGATSDAGTTETKQPPRAAPTSWANLFAKSAAAKAASSNGAATGGAVNGDAAANDALFGGSAPKANANSVAEAVRAYTVGSGEKSCFIEPRGLINTGNMCYMNSILQVLMFCAPFYEFLNQVSQRAAHSFKSATPLIDAMIMFMHEFKVLKSAGSIEQLRRSLKGEDLEKFGEPFTPEFVYEAIRQLPRFASMRRGHQQDAEEFLGFLLQSLDDECTHVMGTSLSSVAHSAASDISSGDGQADASGDWLEVGRKQKAAVTRSSGSNASTPINKIFGGLLRSEFRVPGLKDSITTEPYQPLQLDIGAPDVRNVVDALRGLTRPERLQGDFNSPRGKDVAATKQVFIESLPPVLILHLKRFQFDAEGHGTVKIWKKIDYPLDLEIPREALSRQKRQTMSDGAMPKYKLISVVYHHGKNASGGHYTVDVRRQDGQDWVRFDDTVLRRVRSEDVAEVGSEEDNKESRKENTSGGTSANRFGAMNDEETGDDDGWKQVTASAGGNKRWSSVVNGAGNTSNKGKQVKESVKDNKVAYLLFYQRV